MALEPVGAAANVPGNVSMAAKLNEKLGDKIKNASIILKPEDGPPGQAMPERSDGGPSYGFGRLGNADLGYGTRSMSTQSQRPSPTRPCTSWTPTT